MAPPVDEKTKREPTSAAAMMRFSEPRMLIWASSSGSRTERLTLTWAARWTMPSGRRLRTRWAASGERTSTRSKRAAGLTLASRPPDRSSTTTTSSPRAQSASVVCDPMNPAPPVTRTRICGPSLGTSENEPASGWRWSQVRVVVDGDAGGAVDGQVVGDHLTRHRSLAAARDGQVGVREVRGSYPAGRAAAGDLVAVGAAAGARVNQRVHRDVVVLPAAEHPGSAAALIVEAGAGDVGEGELHSAGGHVPGAGGEVAALVGAGVLVGAIARRRAAVLGGRVVGRHGAGVGRGAPADCGGAGLGVGRLTALGDACAARVVRCAVGRHRRAVGAAATADAHVGVVEDLG